MRLSSDLGVVDATTSFARGSLPGSVGDRPALSSWDLAREINRRLAELGSTVTAEVDRPPRDRTHLLLHGPKSASPGSTPSWEEVVRLSALSTDRDQAVAEVLAAVDSKSWEGAPQSTIRLARSSVWCEPL